MAALLCLKLKILKLLSNKKVPMDYLKPKSKSFDSVTFNPT